MRAGRLRSRARLWRPAETKHAALRETVPGWTYAGTAWLEVRAPRRLLRSYGAGEQPAGTMEAELRAGIDIGARDVLEIYAGPEAGTAWRATTPAHRPGDGSLLVGLEVFHGSLPEPPAPEPPPEPEGS